MELINCQFEGEIGDFTKDLFDPVILENHFPIIMVVVIEWSLVFLTPIEDFSLGQQLQVTHSTSDNKNKVCV